MTNNDFIYTRNAIKANGTNCLLLAPFSIVPITEEMSEYLVEDLERIMEVSQPQSL
ncbi:hypothetical protein [Chryseobacterium sp. CFS15]|uniref:hypothetical protein n=1 Tax=Chryseobacterium sp. CFS15 TaxID=2986946 RepID=UPI002808CFBE|nr:hypothetical protein [Chryseobacterium sp. CFS15]MDQ8143250.1 hypothetical protein [Chryseobacterium sp. CFS15]